MAAKPFTKIKDYTPVELDQAVVEAVDYCDKEGINFWTILTGIDAYMERRRRNEELAERSKNA